MSLFAPLLPAEIERRERERIARRSPHLSLVGKDPRPVPDMFAWKRVEDVCPVPEDLDSRVQTVDAIQYRT